MSALDPRDAVRFSKLLGLLGSDQVGERAAAALKATEFLRAREMGWVDIGRQLSEPSYRALPDPARPSPSHQRDARTCLASDVQWREHELEFLKQMATQMRRPSEKQRDWLDGLCDRRRRSI